MAAPTAYEVETVAREMIELKGRISVIAATAKAEIAPLAEKLELLTSHAQAWLEAFGSAHAEKSRMLHGVSLEIMGTFSSSTVIDAAAVETFRLALVEERKPRILAKLFQKTIRWELRSNWSEIVRTLELPAKLSRLVLLCQVSKPKAPTITPRPKSTDSKAAAV